MKIQHLLPILIVSIVSLASCDHTVSMETTVHSDGSLQKVMVFDKRESPWEVLGISEKNGWKEVQGLPNLQDSNLFIFKKDFLSAEEANAELASPNDTLFRVTSAFEKKFKWFYTYFYYADTYHSLNRMKFSSEAYFTPEDYSFIDRLPAEGTLISKADSLYLSRLTEKAFDIYGMRAIYEEHYDILETLITASSRGKQWRSALQSKKESIFKELITAKDVDEKFFNKIIFQTLDSLHIPMNYDSLFKEQQKLLKKLESKTSFIGKANEGKYLHRINMPGDIVTTNADSVAGNSVIWRPSPIKFMLRDFSMYAHARRLNYWTVIVSLFIVGLTVYLFVRRKSWS